MKTYIESVVGEYTDRKWFLVDAQDLVLGRMSSQIASILRGKHKPIFSPHQDLGDYVIVINADKVKVTGNKEEQKHYFRHSGYIGSLRKTQLKKMREDKPEFIVEDAVRKMIPHNILGRKVIKKLKVYAGSDHPHSANKPEILKLNY